MFDQWILVPFSKSILVASVTKLSGSFHMWIKDRCHAELRAFIRRSWWASTFKRNWHTRELGMSEYKRVKSSNLIMLGEHSMMSCNLTSKKFPTETEYGVWKLLSYSFTYQSQKIRFRSPCEKNHKTSLSKVKFFQF